jgi:hypothetical protein
LVSSGILVSDERKVDKIGSRYALVEAPLTLPELHLRPNISAIQIRTPITVGFCHRQYFWRNMHVLGVRSAQGTWRYPDGRLEVVHNEEIAD